MELIARSNRAAKRAATVSGLLALCNSVMKPVDYAAGLTFVKPLATRAKKPFYSPLWYERPSLRGRSTIKLKMGMRVKIFPCCKQWKGADTENFHIDHSSRIGLSSWCRLCARDAKQKNVNRKGRI